MGEHPLSHEAVTAVGQQTLSAVARKEPIPDAWHELSRELTRPWLGDVPVGSTSMFRSEPLHDRTSVLTIGGR